MPGLLGRGSRGSRGSWGGSGNRCSLSLLGWNWVNGTGIFRADWPSRCCCWCLTWRPHKPGEADLSQKGDFLPSTHLYTCIFQPCAASGAPTEGAPTQPGTHPSPSFTLVFYWVTAAQCKDKLQSQMDSVSLPAWKQLAHGVPLSPYPLSQAQLWGDYLTPALFQALQPQPRCCW